MGDEFLENEDIAEEYLGKEDKGARRGVLPAVLIQILKWIAIIVSTIIFLL